VSRVLPAALLLLGLSLTGCGGAASGDASPRPDGRMVLVSGRDDHGLLAHERVPVYDGPASEEKVGTVPDGTLAHVTRTDGSWLHVVAAEGRPVDGWVDDFYLRGVVHLVGAAPSCEARVDGRPVTAGVQVVVHDLRDGQVLVSGVADPGVRGWASREDVQELAPQPPGCGEDPPDSPHHH
jgi:hypothetical protein